MILVFLDHSDGQIKKSSLEAACYGAKVAEQLGTVAEGVVIGTVSEDLAALGKYGIKKIHIVDNESFNSFDAQNYSKAIEECAASGNTKVIIFPNNLSGKAIAPILSVRLKAGLVSGAVALPDITNGFVVRKNIFSGKAFANVSVKTDMKIITLNPNCFPVSIKENIAEVTTFTCTVDSPKVQTIATNKVEGELPLSEAELVVSGGRGLKGPENWALVTDFAKVIGAATACSRPVADTGWRPHHEHVGQTGLAIAPNLYFAIGISGAIQHLAGVNRSKTIVVINKDPEAPFFKSADYGIVGDAFEVMPKIIEAAKRLKSS